MGSTKDTVFFRTVIPMSSLRDRLALAVRVFREDPDEIVMLSGDRRGWKATYRGTEHAGDTEADALGNLFLNMKWVRDRDFRAMWGELVSGVCGDE